MLTAAADNVATFAAKFAAVLTKGEATNRPLPVIAGPY